ncbi:N-acetylgalactosamine kinase-like [Branchiostoma lanceolatum]|uniref:N-acetylgalactosamine kinase-like n=1 Tax=Branchiostoma lanceolatum TaxID=7740 RepID=UPI0034541D3D
MAEPGAPAVKPVPSHLTDRFTKLRESFKQKYGTDPDFFARAPGRVNLIGEHIDYCGYAVLPMAIEQDIVIAAATTDDQKLTLANVDPSFSEFTSTVDAFTIDKSQPRWYHYFLCGFKGVIEHCKIDKPSGLNIMLEGTVPKSSGLSSSSALVCCSGMTTARANNCSLSKKELAEVCTWCERYIGTEGGGMDQSISFLAEAGTAKLIEFNPLKATDVSLPDGVVFVISNSCVEANKAAFAHYNVRVVECRLAAQLIAKSKGLEWRKLRKLGDLQAALGVSLEEMGVVVDKLLHKDPYSREEVCKELGVTAEELQETSLSQNTKDLTTFQLHDRAAHVYSEADRVFKFKAVCDEKPEDALSQLGRLMNASHASCRDLYNCSCAELDQLTQLCIDAGALGSRLTGAGFGGCAVSLVPADKLQDFLKAVQSGFYDNSPTRSKRVAESLFATQPGDGATFFTL